MFFELTPDRFAYGFLFWSPTVPMMNAMRKDMLEHPDDFLKMIRKVEKKSGMKVEGNSYVRKKPCENEKIDKYYQFRNMYAMKEFPISDELFSPQLADTVREALTALYPLCEYCQRFTSEK